MSNQARRKHLFHQRMKAAVQAGTLSTKSSDPDADIYSEIRWAFRSIQRRPLRMPNLESKDNLIYIQARNERPDDDFDLLDDDLDHLHEDLHDSIGWENYMEVIEKTSMAFNAARDILDHLRRVRRWKYNWRDETGWDDGYLDEVDDYIAPIRRAARETWHKAYSITKHLRNADNPGNAAGWWLPSTWGHRVPKYAAQALVAMHEAYLASMAFQKIVRTLDNEARLAGIDPEDDASVNGMRDQLATFERGEARYAYSLLDGAKEYLTAARLSVSQELGAEELRRQVEKAQAQAIASNAPPIERRKKGVLIRELEPRWPEIADDMRRYEPWIRAAKLTEQHGYWDRAALIRAGRETGRLRDEVEPEIHPLEAFNRRKRMN